MSKHKHECFNCGRGFSTPNGLGLHHRHARRNKSLCLTRDRPLGLSDGECREAERIAAEQKQIAPPVKYDAKKPRFDLVPPTALLEVARVMTYGAQKYGNDNYLKGEMIAPARLIAACMRHVNAALRDEATDPETGLLHLAHAAASLLMAVEVIERRK